MESIDGELIDAFAFYEKVLKENKREYFFNEHLDSIRKIFLSTEIFFRF